MEIIGYIVSLFIGVSLGLIGAGGSILTVPVMVYLFHVPVLEATSYSLFIVGSTSLLGAYYQYKQDQVNGKVAIFFGLVSMSVVSLIRNYVLPKIPDVLGRLHGVAITTSFVSMLMFSILMTVAAWAMIRKKQSGEVTAQPKRMSIRLLWCGIMVGLLTGFLGAGGGFVLIPSLVLFLGLSMKNAVGTSFLIIALNSLLGFSMDLHHMVIQWKLLGFVSLFAAGGILLGIVMSRKISAAQLKVSFGWFVLAVAVLILVKELGGFFIKMQAGHALVGLMNRK